MDRGRDDVDTLRGLACLLLVAFRVIGDNPSNGLRLEPDHALAMSEAMAVHFRLPLFAAIAGFVYAFRPAAPGRLGGFAAGKLKRLAIPAAFAITCFWAMNTVFGGGYAVPPGQVYEIWLFAYAHFWFIQAILILFLIAAAVDVALSRRPLLAAGLMLTVSVALFLSPLAAETRVLSLGQMIYIAPFFVFGILLNRLPGALPGRIAPVIALVALGMFGWHVMDVLADPGAALERRALTSLVAGAVISAALILYRFPVAPLAWAGRYSFTIYLYHFFPILILQRVWEMAGVRPAWIGFAVGMAAGVFLPVLLHWIAVKLGWIVPRLVLGIEGRKAAGGRMPASRLPEKAGA